jgi:hypothetical protein
MASRLRQLKLSGNLWRRVVRFPAVAARSSLPLKPAAQAARHVAKRPRRGAAAFAS